MKNILNYSLYGNSLAAYFVAFAVFFSLIYFFGKIKNYLFGKIKLLSKHNNKFSFGNFLSGFIEVWGIYIYYLCVIYFSLSFLKFSLKVENYYHLSVKTLFIFFSALFIQNIIRWFSKKQSSNKNLNSVIKSALPGISNITVISLWIIVLIILFENLGFKISAIIAGFGIGGIAIAFASQILLKDFFSYISILLDQPFKIGDFIVVGDYKGTIEKIGIKTTRIRSLSGELIIFSNTDLTEARVLNFKHMNERRVSFNLGVTYTTSFEKLKLIPELLKKIISSIDDVRFERSHFFIFGDFSLVFETVYYVKSSDYNKYMDIHHDINLKIKKTFEEYQIDFAFPTQTIYVEKQKNDI